MPDRPISITDVNLQTLYDYWRRKRDTRPAPTRADMKVEDLKYILPYIYVIDVIGPPYRFRFRLAGTKLVEEYGQEITGKLADEIDLGELSAGRILAEYESVARSGLPIASKWNYTKHDGRELNYEHLILPLSTDGKTIDMLFGAAAMKGIG